MPEEAIYPELPPEFRAALATKGDLLALYDALRSTMNYMRIRDPIPDYVRDGFIAGMVEGHGP